jgi:hypothetical protein
VISRDGGPVTAEAIFSRNLTRDLEVFYPLAAVAAPEVVMPGLPSWAAALAEERASRVPQERELGFSQAQVDLYGIKELQVLEDLLRRNRSQRDRQLVAEVAKRIQTKIGWRAEGAVSDWQFLNAFYKAQRGRLERKLLFGKRQG